MKRRWSIMPLLLAVGVGIPAASTASWSPAGTPVCTAPSVQDNPQVCGDGAGGVFIVWADDRASANFDIYGLRLNPLGQIAPGWPSDGKFIASGPMGVFVGLIPDGSGGAYVVYEKVVTGWDLYAQHFGADGNAIAGWPANGLAIAIGPGQQDQAMPAPDDFGGVYVVWEDTNLSKIRGIRLHPDGSVAPGWTAGGRTLSTPSALTPTEPAVAPDGFGGLLATWWEERLPMTDHPAYGFRLTPSGDTHPGWPSTGVLLSQQRPAFLQYQAFVASDGAGGMYCAWADLRNLPPHTSPQNYDLYWDIYGQHVLADGTIAPGWSPNANPLSTAVDTQWQPRIMADGSGGAYVAWGDYRDQASGLGYDEDIYALRVLPDGSRAPGWVTNGNPVATGPGFQDGPLLTPDTHGGAFVGFNDLSANRVFLQHLIGDGTIDPTYAPTGNRVTPGVAAGQALLSLSADGFGGVFAAWLDSRGPSDPSNIWATHIGPDIVTAIAVSLLHTDVRPSEVLLEWQAPKAMRASVERREGSGDSWQTLAEVTTDGEYRLAYDDRSVTPGTSYSYRLSYADGATITHSSETTVLVPRGYTLALVGFRPNPATSSDLAISFELPDAAPGRLELLDVTGRRIAERDLSGYAAGRYSERMTDRSSVAPGVYWLRLTHSGRSLTTRGVVLP